MMEEVFNGIKYQLDEDNMTAEVIQLKDDIQLDDEKLAIEQLFNGYEGDIIIPEAVVFDEHTYRVTSIGKEAFANSYSLKSVTIPDSVTSIGDMAFKGCESLKAINIPDYFASIGENAFLGCESLTSLVISGEKIIGGIKYLLYGNRTAEVIKNEDYYEGDIVIPDTVVFEKVPYRVTSIGRSAFECCENLTSITIPDSVTIIRDNAFSYCFSLTYIIIPSSVKSIGESAFLYCKSLTSVTIPDSVTSIERSVFENCEKLTSIIIPDNVKSIGGASFLMLLLSCICCYPRRCEEYWRLGFRRLYPA